MMHLTNLAMPLLLAAAALLALLAPSKSDLLRDPQAQLPHPGLTGMDMAKLLATVVKTDSATTTVPSSVQVISQIAQAYQASRNASRLKETSQLDHNGYLTDSRTKEKEHPQQNLRRVLLHNTTAMCNDGSPAGYYIRRAPGGSKRWIIFLEGGWYCFNDMTCHRRFMISRHLMSSSGWRDTMKVGGILAADSTENPHLWNANHVYIPYCSSDGWSGASMATRRGQYSFMGAVIVREVIQDLLIQRGGLHPAKVIFLAGSSAGGAGVFLNLDRVADQVRSAGSRARVRGIADSGWFLDNIPYEEQHICTSVHDCSVVTSIRSGLKYWNGKLPEGCTQTFPKDEHWKCYFAYRIYTTLKTPAFVVQYLYDEAQMMIDNVGAPVSPPQWEYIHKNGEKLKKSLENVTALFLASCVSHNVLLTKDWARIRVRDVSLPQAIRCWEKQAHEFSLHEHHHDHQVFDNTQAAQTITSTEGQQHHSDSKPRVRRRRTRKNQKGSGGSGRVRRRKSTEKSIYSARYDTEVIQVQSSATLIDGGLEDGHFQHRWRSQADLCTHRHVDECSWPQCNSKCPRLVNPFTGEEVEFTDLLRSFGLDMDNVASILGIRVSQLYDMSHDALLQILNSQNEPTSNNGHIHLSTHGAHNKQ